MMLQVKWWNTEGKGYLFDLLSPFQGYSDFLDN